MRVTLGAAAAAPLAPNLPVRIPRTSPEGGRSRMDGGNSRFLSSAAFPTWFLYILFFFSLAQQSVASPSLELSKATLGWWKGQDEL